MPTETFALQSDALDTPELKPPAATKDKHRGLVTYFKYEVLQGKDSGKQTPVFRIGLKSLDRNFDTKYTIFVPKMFAENIHIDPSTLPEEEGNNQRKRYAIDISNSKKTANLQRIRQFAQEQGRTLTADVVESLLGDGRTAPDTIQEYALLVNEQIKGMEVVFFRKPQKSDDPRYDGNLEVAGIANISAANDPNKLKDYRAAWDTGETE